MQVSYHTLADGDHTDGSSGSANPIKAGTTPFFESHSDLSGGPSSESGQPLLHIQRSGASAKARIVSTSKHFSPRW